MSTTTLSPADTAALLAAHMDKQHPTFTYTAKLIRRGYNHDVFKIAIKGSSDAYIAHIGRGSRDTGSSLAHARRALAFLEHVGFDSVPRVVSYDAKHDILIETFVGTKDISPARFTPAHVRALARQLAQLHTYSVDEFITFAKKHKLGAVNVANPLKDIDVYGVQRFKLVKKLCPDASVIAWIEPRLKANVLFLKNNASNKKEKGHIYWGDAGDFRTDGKRLYLIDWEFSSVSTGSELGYMQIHAGFSPESFALLTKEYAKASGKSLSTVRKECNSEHSITRLNDVIWAAMKWGEHRNDPALARKYKKLTYKRMKLCGE